MRKLIAAAATAALAFTTIAADNVQPDPPEGFLAAFELKSGEAANFVNDAGTGGVTAFVGCGSPAGQCDYILVNLKSKGTFDYVFEAAYNPADYDVYVYMSDADGTIGEEVEDLRSGTLYAPVADDTVLALAPVESGSFALDKGYYAIEIDYFAAGGGYTLDVALS